jgi:hypothetical protein
MPDPTQNIIDEKFGCLATVIAEELGSIVRCIVEQQMALKQKEIELQMLQLRGLEMLLSGNVCDTPSVENTGV